MPLINLMNDDLLAEPLVQMDETYLQVLQSEKAPSSEHYMVVRAAGPPGRRIVLFTYVPSRTAAALKDLLIGSDGPFRGKLLTDGLELYDIVTESLGLQHFGCLPALPHVLPQGAEGHRAPLRARARPSGDGGLSRQGVQDRAGHQGAARAA